MDTYNINFCFPIPGAIENERVRLRPFIPSKHAENFIKQATQYPEIFDYLPFGPFSSVEDFIDNLVEVRIHKDPGYILLAVFDKTKSTSDAPDGAFAGLMGLINTSPINLATEVGCIMILPPFQRTHISSNAVGLLLHYALDLPSAGGLGLRRVFWQANSLNTKSIRLAERMGLKLEGILRWDRVLPANKDAGNGRGVREGDPRAGCLGRDTAMLGICWDDWEEGGREHVDKVMARTR
ncbi:acyl-CoA N-acyltransferase [Crucibulum laeve]|uniref:Acyl-CoA N-acyltransferase n=1 Tax=Crucibulum laeve TaxID=68775 RepID=A0A5C3LZN0_9AGAR|nr:acyl-CoA N-acyltransferase [Crucibulum laeve]